MSAPRDSSSDDEFFYMHFFDESDTDSDDDADFMVVVATILNEENEAYMPQWRCSVKGEPSIWTATGRTATCSSTLTTSTRKRRCTETIFGTISGCQGSYLGE
jgi:hypothetical protein